MHFRQRLEAEFAQRRQRNARYSLRAFARDLGTDHSTLSQILRERRALSARKVALLGHRLKLERGGLAEACVRQNAEAVLRLARSRNFRPNTRWIATRTGISMDGINAALAQLLREGNLVMTSTQHWKITK